MPRKYTGKGAFLPGIPARDLTDDEWNALSADDKKAAERSGLYQSPPTKEPVKEEKKNG